MKPSAAKASPRSSVFCPFKKIAEVNLAGAPKLSSTCNGIEFGAFPSGVVTKFVASPYGLPSLNHLC